MTTTRRFTVVAGVLRDRDGRILLTRRPAGRHMAGLWEFPGGKLEPEESPAAGLERELLEELGIEARCGDPVTFAVHQEPGLEILLLFFEARILAGELTALDGQQMAWVEPVHLEDFATPPADAELVRKLVTAAGAGD